MVGLVRGLDGVDDLVDRAGEGEGRLLFVADIDDLAVVATDVESGVSG
jgi:hypothetical protein